MISRIDFQLNVISAKKILAGLKPANIRNSVRKLSYSARFKEIISPVKASTTDNSPVYSITTLHPRLIHHNLQVLPQIQWNMLLRPHFQ